MALTTLTWQCEEFTLRTFGKDDYGLTDICADIEDDGTDWTVARVGFLGTYNPHTRRFQHLWLDDNDPLAAVIKTRIYMRYPEEIDRFLGEQARAA